MTRTLSIWIVGLALVLAFAVASPTTASQEGDPEVEQGSDDTSADQPQPKRSVWVQATGGKRTGAPVKVYRNEDLERIAGLGPASSGSRTEDTTQETPAGPPAEGTAPPAEEKSALDLMFEKQAAQREHAEKIAEAELRVEAARKRIVEAEKRLLAVRNPLLARPKAPEEGWEEGGGEQRAQQSKDVLQAARDELAQAEQELDQLRRSVP